MCKKLPQSTSGFGVSLYRFKISPYIVFISKVNRVDVIMPIRNPYISNSPEY